VCHYYSKFAFDTMISDELGIPKSVADFIERRIPKKRGTRHHIKMVRKADATMGDLSLI
jgi:intergrase/recombinase